MTDKEKLIKIEKLADAMYYAAQYLTTDASRLHKAMDEYRKFIINEYHKEEPTIPDIVDEHFHEMLGEEPVSEDLEEACEQLAENARKHKAETSSPFFSPTDYKQGVMDGAKWQKAKDESTTEDLGEYINELSKQFPEVSFAKLSRIAVRVAKWQKEQDQSTIELAEDHAMLAGMEKMKEQMVGKAIDVEVKVDAGGYPYIPQIELYNYDKDVPLAKEGDKYKVVLIKEE